MDDGRIDAVEAVKAHVEKDKLPFVVVHDYKAVTTRKYGVNAFPAAYLIGADGKVIWNGTPHDGIVKELEGRIEAAIAEAKKMAALARAEEARPNDLRPPDGPQDGDSGSDGKSDEDDDPDDDEDDDD